MRTILMVLAAASLAAPAMAQAPGSSAANPAQVDRTLPAPSPSALQLSRRYIELVQAQAMNETMFSAIKAAMALTRPAGMSAQMTEALDPAPVMREIMPAMMERMAVLQAQVYSEGELQALVDFYGSPVGRSVVAKTPRLAPGMTAVMAEFSPRIQEGITRRLCAIDAGPPMCRPAPGR